MSPGSREIADSALVRRLNAARVLTALRAEPALSSSALVSRTDMARPTVLAAAQLLVRLGWATESGGGTGARGRPSRVFAFRADAGHVLGLDVGARTVRARLADLRGEVVARAARTVPDPRLPAAERLALVRECALGAVHEAGLAGHRLLAVCAGTSGPVDPDGAVHTRTGIPGFLGTGLRTALAEEFGPDVVVENDCNLAALAERRRGLAAGGSDGHDGDDAPEGDDDTVCLLAGERLGVGAFVGGTLLRGAHNRARDLGFLALMPDAARDLPAGASPDDGIGALARAHGARLVAELADAGGRPAPGAPGAVLYGLAGGTPERVDAETVFAAVRAGDTAAPRLLDGMLAPAAHAVATLSMLLAPRLVVVSGAVAAAGDVLLEPLRRRVARLVPAVPRIAASPLRDEAVVTGAVCLALEHAEARYLTDLRPAPGC
ncbi:ROK family protein [Streptomyces cacaoi]|uniref:ROK family protein n=1 Tax=Streptomyces cacaoi TaxID=1898 RepID=UPI003321378D